MCVCMFVCAPHTHNHRIPPPMNYSVSKSVSHRVFLAEVGLCDRECPLVTASEKVSLCETECRKIIFILVKGAWVTGLVGQCVTECLYVPQSVSTVCRRVSFSICLPCSHAPYMQVLGQPS